MAKLRGQIACTRMTIRILPVRGGFDDWLKGWQDTSMSLHISGREIDYPIRGKTASCAG